MRELIIKAYLEKEGEEMRFAKPETEHEKQDFEANMFALALLLPEKVIREIGEKYGVDLADESVQIAVVAQKLGVSYGTIMFRLGQIFERRYSK